jgi:hypothetical protein
LRSSRNTLSGIIVAFSTIPRLANSHSLKRQDAPGMPFKRKIPGLPLACNERSQTASGSHLVCVDLLPLLNSHKSSGKLVLERSELGKSCLRQNATLFAEGTQFSRDIFCQKRQKMPHCLTKNLLLDSSPNHLHLKWFLPLQQGHLLVHVPLHKERKLLSCVH